MAKGRCYPTAFAGLWYRNDGEANHKKADWRFVDERTRDSIGPSFPDRIDLLAAVPMFAAANGYTERIDQRPPNPPEPPKPDPVAPQPIDNPLVPGTSVDSLWRTLCASARPTLAPDGFHNANLRRAFYAGFWAMLEVMGRGGEPDVSPDEAASWLASLRAECRAFRDS